MTNGDQMSALWYLLLLILPLSALIARGIPIGQTMRMALIWIGIFAAGLIIATFWTRNRSYIDGFLVDAGLSSNVVTGSTVELARGEGGHFWADVVLNGVSRRMLVDTGATSTTISRTTAKAVGATVDEGFGVLVDTANGQALAHRATLGSLQLGSIRAKDLPVLVSDTDGTDLLGIDFLSQLKSWRAEGNRLILVPRGS